MRNIKQAFGQRVRQIRIGKGLTLEDLAGLSNLHSTYIGSVERGERNISLEATVKLAKGLDVELFELFLVNPDQRQKNFGEFIKTIEMKTSTFNEKQRKFILSLLDTIVSAIDDL